MKWFWIFALLFANKAFARIENQKKIAVNPICKKLSPSCSICSDGKMRKPGEIDFRKTLNFSPFECASQKSTELNRYKCLPISDFCEVCSDQKFKALDKHEVIATDLYECATKPKTMVYEQSR